MSKGTDGVLRRRCLGECLKQGEGRTIVCEWIAADQLFCANGCALKCVLCYGPLTDDDKLHTCADCTDNVVEGRVSWSESVAQVARSILSGNPMIGEKRMLEDFIGKREGSPRELRGWSREKLRVRRLAWIGVLDRDRTLFKRLKVPARRPPRKTPTPKQKTTKFGKVSGRDIERAKCGDVPDLGLTAAAAAQLPEEDAHGAETVQRAAEDVAENTLADVVLARADGSGSAASTARATQGSRGASRLASRFVSGDSGRQHRLGTRGAQRVRATAAAIAQTRRRGWLGEDEAPWTPVQIERKRRRAELRENPELSKNKMDGTRNVEHEKRMAAKDCDRKRRKRKRERLKRQGD